jgi:hypothetical protein
LEDRLSKPFSGTLSPDTNQSIPTVADNAFANEIIPANEIGISFEPAQDNSTQIGELTWGAYIRKTSDSARDSSSSGTATLATLALELVTLTAPAQGNRARAALPRATLTLQFNFVVRLEIITLYFTM